MGEAAGWVLNALLYAAFGIYDAVIFLLCRMPQFLRHGPRL